MAKTRGKTKVPPSTEVVTQLTLEQFLEQQPNQSVEWEFEEEDIGGDLIGIMSKGLYSDPLDCIREYVQNSVDGKAKTVVIKITGNSVTISDDGLGMAIEDLRKARRFGISNKSPSENVGFRGIGIYSGFDICNRLLVTTKVAGEARAHILEFDFGEMKALLKAEREAQAPRTSLAKVITKYTHFRREEDRIERHYTIIQLEELSSIHIGQLADHEKLRSYMLHNLPIDFADHFPYKDQINSQLESHVPGYNAIKIKLVTDFSSPEIIVKPNIPYLSEPILGLISTTDGKPVAYYWACYHEKGELLPNEYKDYRGLVYKVKGFTIGDRERLRVYFPTARGTLYYWCTGEIYIIDDKITPNAARNDFEVSSEKLQLETAVSDTLRALNLRIEKFQEQNNADKDFEKARTYLEEIENKISGFNPTQCKEAHEILVKFLFNLPKKLKKTKLDPALAQEIIQRTEALRDKVRQMIDQPDKPTIQPIVNRSSPTNLVPPMAQSSSKAASTEMKPISASSTSPFESEAGPVLPVQNGPLSKAPIQNDSSLATSVQNNASSTVTAQNNAPLLQPTKTVQQIFEQSGFDLDGNCTQLLQMIDGTLSSVLTREMYMRILDNLEARLEYEVTEEIESEDE